ncbi:MAG: HisA/HisF-related TIM barrel protein [Gammaproteobacteria bacterium]|nr:HisA/HisF-related TIM barrel protein [Gammaproteobacteria bacterium]MCI0591651.1 HisA/HisF-related TIM barrel protein [Gammaproteobacteria bacterium]
MLIIPVLDLCQGHVVHARAGKRQAYEPVSSFLCPSSNPAAVVVAILTIYPFTTFYIADLDAIEGVADNTNIIEELCAAFPSLTFWIDSGPVVDTEVIRNLGGRWKAVVGSEYQQDLQTLSAHLQRCPPPILSLDFVEDRLQGPKGVLEIPALWPPEIIVVSLNRVGTLQGPDLERLATIKTLAPGKSIYAAGGVRHENDLWALEVIGITGALVATALHSGHIGQQSIDALLRKSG